MAFTIGKLKRFDYPLGGDADGKMYVYHAPAGDNTVAITGAANGYFPTHLIPENGAVIRVFGETSGNNVGVYDLFVNRTPLTGNRVNTKAALFNTAVNQTA